MTVAKYPVENGDIEGQVDAINYLLSGPAGLGQNFAGFSTYVPAYLRPTIRQPFVTPTTLPGIPIYGFYAINNATGCDENGTAVLTLTPFARYDFTTPFASPPYTYGDRIIAQNFNPSDYDSGGNALVYDCTTTYVIIQYNSSYVFPAYISGGEVGTDRLNTLLSTDCNGRVTVNGGSDRVFVSGQLICSLDYTSTMASEFDVIVQINRYTGYVSNSPGSTDFIFADPIVTVAERTFHYNVNGVGTITDLETIFSTLIDGPDIPFGYYWYILEFKFATEDSTGTPYPGDATCGVVTLGLRSLAAQVVKQ